jgi:2-oxoglutarate ferredoxin oxidoreductase subunit beta
MLCKKFFFTTRATGDLAAIGTSETIHACNRGENILIVFINYVFTADRQRQMAPTTLEGKKSQLLLTAGI